MTDFRNMLRLSEGKRILVIGDGMTDVYVHGRTEACQEGCTKFMEQTRVCVPGGALNAARSIMHWNAKITYRAGKGYGVPIKTRFMDGDQCVFRHDEDHRGLDLNVVRTAAFDDLWFWRPHAVLLSDYDKGTLTAEFIAKVVETCRLHHVPVVADVKREPVLYAGCILKGNQLWNRKYERSKIDSVGSWVITQGDGPPFGYDNNTAWTMNPREPVLCVNHVGAGDCFAAHLTLALACGYSLKESAALAYSAGRVYVQARHNCPPAPEDVFRDLEIVSAG